MRWLTAVLVLLLFGLAAFPATVWGVGAWIAHRADNVQSVNYISRDIHELSASRRQAAHKHHLERRWGVR